jgi:hypothetical protein
MRLAPMIVNLAEVRGYFAERIQRQLAVTGDEELAGLLEELAAYPVDEEEPDPVSEAAARGILMPLRLRAPDGGELSFFATVTTFGTALDLTTSELSMELAFPADASTANALQSLARK